MSAKRYLQRDRKLADAMRRLGIDVRCYCCGSLGLQSDGLVAVSEGRWVCASGKSCANNRRKARRRAEQGEVAQSAR